MIILRFVCARAFWLGMAAAALGWSGAASAQAGLCENPQAECGAAVSSDCLSRVGAGSLPAAGAGGDCEAQFTAYRACLIAVVEQCSADEQPAPARTADAPAPAQKTVLPPGHRQIDELRFEGRRFILALSETPASWPVADQIARSLGGRLAKIDSPELNDAIGDVLVRRPVLFNRVQVLFNGWYYGPWIGGFQRPSGAEPAGGWTWGVDSVSGLDQPVRGDHWFSAQPDEFAAGEDFMQYFCIDQPSCDTWNDATADAPVFSYIVELND